MTADQLQRLLFGQTAVRGEIETQCHFCNSSYVFSPADVEALIEDPDASPPTVH